MLNQRLTILFILLFNALSASETQKSLPIVVCHLDLLTQNAPTATLMCQALKNMSKLIKVREKSLRNTAKLAAMTLSAATIAHDAEEIAKKNPGTTNVVRELLAHLRSRYGDFYETDFASWCDLAIAPEPKIDFAKRMKTLKKNYITIGICNHDPLEHYIYRKKLKDQYNIDLEKLFTVIVGIPSQAHTNEMSALLEAKHPRLGKKSICRGLKTENFQCIYGWLKMDNYSNFVVAPEPYPYKGFVETLKVTARQVQKTGDILIIDPDPARIAAIQNDSELTVKGISSLPLLCSCNR